MNTTNKKQVVFLFVMLFGITNYFQACDMLKPASIFTDCDEDDLCSFTKTVILHAPITEYRIEKTWPDSIVYWDLVDAFLDLDSGEKKNNEKADIYYTYSCGSMCFDIFWLWEDTLSREVGAQNIGYKGCYQAIVEEGSQHLIVSTQEANMICFLTNEGRISQVRVDENRTSGGEAEIVITVTTWEPIVTSVFPTD